MSKQNIRTKGNTSQHDYDNLLADLDISSLRFLEGKYKRDIEEFKYNHNLDNKDHLGQYKDMQQRFNMIIDEIENREKFSESNDLYTRDTHFNNNDIVLLDSGKRKILRPSYSEDEESIEIVEVDEEDQ